MGNIDKMHFHRLINLWNITKIRLNENKSKTFMCQFSKYGTCFRNAKNIIKPDLS